eukprot:8785038-Heterocapsa_arctica.AAC.1
MPLVRGQVRHQVRGLVVALALGSRVLYQAECIRQGVHIRGPASGRCPPEALPDTVLSPLALLATKDHQVINDLDDPRTLDVDETDALSCNQAEDAGEGGPCALALCCLPDPLDPLHQLEGDDLHLLGRMSLLLEAEVANQWASQR